VSRWRLALCDRSIRPIITSRCALSQLKCLALKHEDLQQQLQQLFLLIRLICCYHYFAIAISYTLSFCWRAILTLQFCPPVRLSVRDTLVLYENRLTYRHSFFSLYGSPIILVLFYQRQTSSRNSDGVTPCWGAKYRWGIKIVRFSTNKSLYLGNDSFNDL